MADVKGEKNQPGWVTEGDPLPVLHMMVGLPRSGKSTQARLVARKFGYPIVCPDEIRIALHGQAFVLEAEPMVAAIAKIMVTALFGAGHRDVILDGCHVTRRRRDQWLNDSWWRKFHEVDTDVETCKQRARDTFKEELIPVIESFAAKLEPIEAEELR